MFQGCCCCCFLLVRNPKIKESVPSPKDYETLIAIYCRLTFSTSCQHILNHLCRRRLLSSSSYYYLAQRASILYCSVLYYDRLFILSSFFFLLIPRSIPFFSFFVSSIYTFLQHDILFLCTLVKTRDGYFAEDRLIHTTIDTDGRFEDSFSSFLKI